MTKTQKTEAELSADLWVELTAFQAELSGPPSQVEMARHIVECAHALLQSLPKNQSFFGPETPESKARKAVLATLESAQKAAFDLCEMLHPDDGGEDSQSAGGA